MTRYVIVCAFDEPPPDALAEELELTDRLRLVRGEERPDLWISWASFHELEPRLAAALAEGKVGSAAMLPTLPPPEQRWILTEWRGQLAVHGSIANQLDPRFWAGPSRYDLIDLRVFMPSGEEPLQSMAGPTARPGPPRAAWVETVAEYRGALDANKAVLITAPAQQILTRMRNWFGDLADERVGGAVAVLSMSGIKPSAQTQVVLRSPAALGLRRASGATTLPALSQAGEIETQAWGTSSENPTRGLARPRPGYDKTTSRSLTAELAAFKASTGAPYGVLIRLRARADTEVRVKRGLVFEQQTLSRAQNLVIASGTTVSLPGGRSASLALPAWCLNRRLAPPSGEPVRPTPLYMPLTAGMTQGTLWRIAERFLDNFGGPE
jgi:hypothetical protein